MSDNFYLIHCMQSTSCLCLHKNCHSSCIWQLWTALTCFQYTGTCPAHSPLLGIIRGLRTSETTLEFYDKIITNQDVRIYVNIWTTLYSDLTNVACKGFSNSHFYLFYHILSCLYLIYITVSHCLYLRNNTVIICTTAQRSLSLSLFIFFCLSSSYLMMADLDSRNMLQCVIKD